MGDFSAIRSVFSSRGVAKGGIGVEISPMRGKITLRGAATPFATPLFWANFGPKTLDEKFLATPLFSSTLSYNSIYKHAKVPTVV
jgi:hypothetical protein